MGVRGLEVGSKNRSKIDQKMKSRWEGILASIFHGFWSILEAKLAPSWGRKSIKNRSKMASKNRCQKEGDKIGKNRQKSASWRRLGRILVKNFQVMRGSAACAWAVLRQISAVSVGDPEHAHAPWQARGWRI